jgi:hypothetical protein
MMVTNPRRKTIDIGLYLAGREQRVTIYIEFLYLAPLSTLEFLCAICDMQSCIARLAQFQAKSGKRFGVN